VSDDAELAAIRALVEGYAIALDTHDEALFSSLWTDDAVLTIHKDGQQTGAYEGVESMPRVVALLRTSYRATVHVVGSHRATIRDDRRVALGVTSGVAHHIAPPAGTTGPLVDRQLGLRYVDGYRWEGGRWLIASRQCHQLWLRSVDVEQP
jgi:hypothetical protein